jgi:hypothetical protein
LISNWDFAKDAQASLGYSSSEFFGGNFAFGGNFSFKPEIPQSGGWTFGAKRKGWARFNFLQVTLGNDIETNYADWQGADDGLMIYNGTEFENPDNITNSSGLLLEALLNPFTFAVAAGDFSTAWKPTDRIENRPNDDNIYKDTYNYNLSYGARVGYGLGDRGKVNASYKIYYDSRAESFKVPGGDFSDLEPVFADAEVFQHVFGLYGSLYFGSLGLTAGYLGHALVYLSEFHRNGEMVETAVPLIYKNGVALNAQWKAPSGLALRTDHSVTFWRDKNYESFGKKAGIINWGLEHKGGDEANYTFIDYFVMRNGLGAGYYFTNRMEGNVFLQNTLFQNSGSRMQGSDAYKYTLIEDTARIELGLSYHFNTNATVFIKLDVSDTFTSRSSSLTGTMTNFFVNSVHNEKPEPVAVTDSVLAVRIPVGITLKIK